jgi:ankyrin repeat protein
VVAIRPLRVEELAEVIAFDFDDTEGLPKLDASWRWGDQEQALLSSCSSLIAIADAGDSRVVQFSHFSVKEFLTSSRLAASEGDVSRYHVDLEPAHTILAQACLSVLLKLDDRVEKNSFQQSLPLAQYAAEHWTSHAQFKDVSTRIHEGMECLFDPNKPHFLAWLRFHDIDTYLHPRRSRFFQFTPRSPSQGGPLYYASLCGFHDLAKYLIIKYPEQVNTCGGCYVIPLLAALSREHFQTAELLYQSGADPNVLGHCQKTPLHSAAFYGNLQMVEALIKYNADINAQDHGDRTPLHEASSFSTPNGSNIVRLLLDHGAGANARRQGGSTPLHDAAREGLLEAARALLEHGADVHAEDNQGKTPFQVVSAATYSRDRDEIMKLLRDQGAK